MIRAIALAPPIVLMAVYWSCLFILPTQLPPIEGFERLPFILSMTSFLGVLPGWIIVAYFFIVRMTPKRRGIIAYDLLVSPLLLIGIIFGMGSLEYTPASPSFPTFIIFPAMLGLFLIYGYFGIRLTAALWHLGQLLNETDPLPNRNTYTTMIHFFCWPYFGIFFLHPRLKRISRRPREDTLEAIQTQPKQI